jgi:hypothetical protein
MMQTPAIQRVNQALQHMLLADHFVKFVGAPFAREDLV